MATCTCENPAFGFNCVCEHVVKHPGDIEFSCEFCGIYDASIPRCSKCMRCVMPSFRITFADGNTIVTDMNATLAEAQEYYMNRHFNFGDTEECPKDNMVAAVLVEQL